MYAFISEVKRKTAQGILEEQVRQLLTPHGKAITITQDNGNEFTQHEKLSEELTVDVYFVHPYGSGREHSRKRLADYLANISLTTGNYLTSNPKRCSIP